MVGNLEQNINKVDRRLAFLKLNSTNHHSHTLKKRLALHFRRLFCTLVVVTSSFANNL